MSSSSQSARRARRARSRAISLSLVWLLSFGSLPLVSLAQFQPSAAPQMGQKQPPAEFVPGEVIVRYRTEEAADLSENEPAAELPVGRRRVPLRVERFGGSEIVKGLRLARVPAEDTLAAVEALKARADVLYAEPNYVRRKLATPNDPSFKNQWGLKNTGQPVSPTMSTPVVGADIDAEPAWNITTGSRSVVVGVVDEGIDINHPDLQANIWKNPGEVANNGIDDDANGFVDDVNGWDFFHNDKTVYDGTGAYPSDDTDAHGTHVAGTIGATGNNSIGVVGVNWQVSLMSLKVLGHEGEAAAPSSVLVTVRAYNYAKMMRDLWASSGGAKGANIRVLNNSYGGGGRSQAELDAINALNTSGILFVAAAGNDSSSNDAVPVYPASYDAPNLISVAATDNGDSRMNFSNYGPLTVTIGAPGTGILSTTPGGTYDTFAGTSMAAPHVAGVAALVCASKPTISLKRLRAALIYSGDVFGTYQDVYSRRRLNALKALQNAAENDTTPPAAIGNLYVSIEEDGYYRLYGKAPGDDGMTGTAALYEVSFTDTQPTTAAQFEAGRRQIPALLPAAPGTEQEFRAGVPRRHTSGFINFRAVDNAGNAGPITSLPATASEATHDPYVVTTGPAQPLSTSGTPLNLKGDDQLIHNYYLPYYFPFYGMTFSTAAISTNGALYIAQSFPNEGQVNDSLSSIQRLNSYQVIAGLWDDLRTDRRAGDDVYVVKPDSNRVIFRWQAVTFDTPLSPTSTRGENPVSFEIELQRNGTITLRYGAGNQKLWPVVGISVGAPEAYVAQTHTSETALKNLTNAQTIVFTPRRVLATSLTALTVTSPSVIGGKTVTGKVTLSEPASNGGATVTLSDDLPSASVPASVTVPAGATSVTFPVTTSYVKAKETGTITAKFGESTQSTPFTVNPTTISVLTPTPSTVIGGNSVAVKLKLNGPAPPAGAVIALSDNLAATNVPASVTVPGGATEANFNITTVNVTASQTGRLTATFGSSSRTAALTVRPIGVASVAVEPRVIAGGSSATGTVVLEKPAVGNMTVSLAGNVAASTVPASIVVPNGATSKTFTITTKAVTAPQGGTLTASLNGISKTAPYGVNPPPTVCAAPNFIKSSALPFKLTSAVAADFNSDGYLDLAGPSSETGELILAGDGVGNFAQLAKYAYGPGTPAALDLNLDGKLDLMVPYYGGRPYDLRTLLGDGTGVFKNGKQFGIGNAQDFPVVADFNKDGKLDLLTRVNWADQWDYWVLPGDGAGGIGYGIRLIFDTYGREIAAGDFNKDGNLDLALATYNPHSYDGGPYYRVSIHLGNGAGNFGSATNINMGTNTNPTGVAAGDFNKDGKLDLAVTLSTTNQVAVMLGNGLGGFGAPTKLAAGQNPQRVAATDLNKDGKPDLVIVNPGTGVSVMFGNGAGGFSAVKTYATGVTDPVPTSVIIGDFNSDGRPDLLLPMGAQGLTLMSNVCG